MPSFVDRGVGVCVSRQCFEVKCVDTAPFQGRCITGANQVSVIVQITDICPECAADHIDIQALTYNKLSKMETGRINVMYRCGCSPTRLHAELMFHVPPASQKGSWVAWHAAIQRLTLCRAWK